MTGKLLDKDIKTFDVCGSMVEVDGDIYDEHPGAYIRTSDALERFRAYDVQWFSGLNRETAMAQAHAKSENVLAMVCALSAVLSFLAGFIIASIFA